MEPQSLCQRESARGKGSCGAVHYLDPGNVPIPKEVLEYHKDALRQKMDKKQGLTGYHILVEDLMTIAKGECLTI